MQLTLSENLLWMLGTGLKLLLCGLVFYRQLYRRLPFFSTYAALLVGEVTVVWWVYREWGFLSRPAWYTYWTAAFAVLLARALVVAELCWTSLRNYPAIWSLVRKLLLAVALVVLTYAGIMAFRNNSLVSAFVLTAEQGLEVSLMAILVALLGFAVRYKVPLESLRRSIVIGLGIYSGFQVINNTFMNQWMTRYFHWWNLGREVSFDLALVLWTIPLYKVLPPPEPGPVLISEQVAVRLLRELLAKMRDLTDELNRIVRSVWK
jgi:hypothetical protein